MLTHLDSEDASTLRCLRQFQINWPETIHDFPNLSCLVYITNILDFVNGELSEVNLLAAVRINLSRITLIIGFKFFHFYFL